MVSTLLQLLCYLFLHDPRQKHTKHIAKIIRYYFNNNNLHFAPEQWIHGSSYFPTNQLVTEKNIKVEANISVKSVIFPETGTHFVFYLYLPTVV